MNNDSNQYQIIRKDARNCFVESLRDAFDIGKAHFVFAAYDLSKPVGERQTNKISIYISIEELLELHRKIVGGELRFLIQNKKKTGDKTPLYQSLGGTSAEQLAKYGQSRKDGKSLSRIVKLTLGGTNAELFFVADSGPGEKSKTGLIVPKFGTKPENHVAVGMSFEAFSEFILMTYAHYTAWLSSWYANLSKADKAHPKASGQPQQSEPQKQVGCAQPDDDGWDIPF